MWKKWFQRFERFRSASGLSDKPQEILVNSLIYCTGVKLMTFWTVLVWRLTRKKEYGTVTRSLTEYFIPKRNVIFERVHLIRGCTWREKMRIHLSQACINWRSTVHSKLYTMTWYGIGWWSGFESFSLMRSWRWKKPLHRPGSMRLSRHNRLFCEDISQNLWTL